jgi:prophage maintenance system killer protein
MAKRRIIKRLSVEEVERIAFTLAQKHLTFDEPIPDFSTRFPNILEGCMATPFQKFFGKVPYPSLTAKAGMLFYLLIKDHPFQNGNKRIALTTLIVFLLKNDLWLEADVRQIYKFTVWVATSRPEDKDFVLMAINEFIKKHLKPLTSTPLF